MFNFHSNILEAIQVVWFSIFCKPIIIHPVYAISPRSSFHSGPSFGMLNLADFFVLKFYPTEYCQ